MVTDTVVMKSNVENVFLKIVVLGTTKQWSHHTEILVFCVKFRHLSVCKYLNYYYDITNVITSL